MRVRLFLLPNCSSLPPSMLRDAPRDPCSPTPRPLATASSSGTPVLPTSGVARKSRIAWLHRSSVNSSAILVRYLLQQGPVAFWSPPGRAASSVGSSTAGSSWRGLDLVLAPPTRGIWASRGPLKILAGEAVSRLELVEAGGEPFVGARHRGVRLLLHAGSVHAVLGLAEPLLGPALRLCPLHFREAAFGWPRISGGGGSLKQNHSTLWASGSSAASFPHSSAISFPSMLWWLGHHRISIRFLGA